MKIVLTSSLGHIGKPLAIDLIKKGHHVIVISSKREKEAEIRALGATPAIGLLTDLEFLKEAFTGADIAYLMEYPVSYFDKTIDIGAHRLEIANSYVQAVQASGITQIIYLSSIGAHTNKGNGLLHYHYEVEEIIKKLSDTVNIKFMRPVGFYSNMFAYIPSIKSQDVIIQNYGGDEKEPWVSPIDIAHAISEEVEKPFSGKTIRYIASDEASPNEVAQILGEAIGKPNLKWVTVSDEQFLEGLLNIGMSPQAAKGYTEMNASRRSNAYEDYEINRPEKLGNIKLKQFAEEFAKVYHKK